MDNYAIADALNLLSKLMDIHGENSFKAKSYAAAAFTIEKLPQALTSLPEEEIIQLKGIGDSVGSKIIGLIKTGELELLQKYIANTPPGVLEMMNIKGLGPKKINTLWKEWNIDTIQQLKESCEKNELAEKKGFGEKTQQSILKAIEFQQQAKGSYLYAQAEAFAEAFDEKLQDHFKDYKTAITGSFRRHLEIIEKLEWVTTIPNNDLKNFLIKEGVSFKLETDDLIIAEAQNILELHFHITTDKDFYNRLFTTGSSPEFLEEWKERFEIDKATPDSEEQIFAAAQVQYIPPFLREKKDIISAALDHALPQVIQTADIKGIIHSHSNWSDGVYTIEQMAEACMQMGFEYLVVSDHSKAAFYANGLSEQRLKEQHKYIDALNDRFKPFKIFKSIECDILTDGSMDYTNRILSAFDLVIASVHSNLTMDKDKAMKRLLGAITNPYVTILGHMTGRILLRREGYPVDHKQIIDACAENGVVIEINASPSRLDMDWRWIEYALQKKVMLSINPDAHATEEFHNIKYGVLVAQKGGLTKNQNVSSYSRDEFEQFLQSRRQQKNLNL